jgi:hypothetical protein
LVRAGVDLIVVGVAGINFYARDATQLVVTADVDVLLRRRAEVLRAALAALEAAGFQFESGGEPFLDAEDEQILERIVETGASLAALGRGARIDLMLSIAGFDFDDLDADAERFRLGDQEVAVGRLDKLLRSKELAGRAKDREFLRLFAARLREEAGEPE